MKFKEGFLYKLPHGIFLITDTGSCAYYRQYLTQSDSGLPLSDWYIADNFAAPSPFLICLGKPSALLSILFNIPLKRTDK